MDNNAEDVKDIESKFNVCLDRLENDNIWRGDSKEQLMDTMIEVSTSYFGIIAAQMAALSQAYMLFTQYQMKQVELASLQGSLSADLTDDEIASIQSAISTLEGEIKELESAIKSLLAQIVGMKIGGAATAGGSGNKGTLTNIKVDYFKEVNGNYASEITDEFVSPINLTATTSSFDENREKFGKHGGVDLIGPNKNCDIYSVKDGVVVHAGKDYDEEIYQGTPDGDTYGNYVVIQHEDQSGKTYYTLYAHLSKVFVANGQEVTSGTTIGKQGNTGNTNGLIRDSEGNYSYDDEKGFHLHFELRVPQYEGQRWDDFDSRVDPSKILSSTNK